MKGGKERKKEILSGRSPFSGTGETVQTVTS